IFRPLAMTYTFALVAALCFSLTVVPAFCALLLRRKDAEASEPRFVEKLRSWYSRGLLVVLRRRYLAVVAALLLLVACGRVTVFGLGREFLPQLDEGDLVVFVEMPPSIAIEKGQEVLVDVRRRLINFPEVAAVMSEQGRPEDGTDNEGVNMSETFVKLKPE